MKTLLISLSLCGLVLAEPLTVPPSRTVNGHPLTGNVTVTKSDVGLGNVDNTSDANKPVSTAQQTAFNDAKVESTRLVNYRAALASKRPSVLFYGDSMIGTASEMTTAISQLYTAGGSGSGLLGGGLAGGAVIEKDACLKWINGETWKLSNTGHMVTLGSAGGTFSVVGDTLKIYYLRQPGGGIFQIQSDMNMANSFANEGATIDTNGALAGMVVTITKSNYRQTWRIRCVWSSANGQVTGALGAVNIIGGGVRDSRSSEGLVSFITNGSTTVPDNNLSAASLTPRAITDPIMADLAPNLVVMSHLDGAGSVGFQATFQDNINAGIVSTGGLAASWLVISSPAGPTPELDALSKLQMEAQRTLANARGDGFFDNYTWMGGSVKALADGNLANPGDVHPTAKAQTVTAAALIRDSGLPNSKVQNDKSTRFLDIVGGGKFFGYVDLAQEANSVTTYHEGSIRLVAPPGSLTGGPVLFFEPYNAIPGSANAGWSIKGDSVTNGLDFSTISQPMWRMQQNVGFGAPLYMPTSTAATPDGVLGTTASPIREINLGKTVNTNATVGNVTIDKCSGRIWFDVGATTLTVTNARCLATSIIKPDVMGSDATATSVRVTTVSAGSFVLTLNAPTTAKTEVSWVLFP
jgi:hypothetical protein